MYGSDSTVKAAKVFERAKDEIEKMLHFNKTKETHGQRDDIGEDTPLNEVKAPNLLERAVEEYEAFIQTIHSKKESSTFDKRSQFTCFYWLSSNEVNLVLSLTCFISCNAFEGMKQPILHQCRKKQCLSQVTQLSNLLSNLHSPQMLFICALL